MGASALGFLTFAPATAFAASAPSNATNLGYTPITPARVCDTRSTSAAGGSDVVSGVTGQCDNSGTALASGSELDVAIPTSVVPSGASAVVLNVTAIGASAPGYLSTYAATGAAPTSTISNLNFAAGQDVANSVTVQDNAGAVDVYFGPSSPSATVNVAVDVQGYYMTPSSTTGDPYTAITPTRVADTRCGESPTPSYCSSENLPSANSALKTVGANSSVNVQVAGVGSIPSDATAVALNVTETSPTAASYLKVYPTGATPATTSNQNWAPGETLASQVVSKVGTGGDVSLYNYAGSVNYIVDVDGYYTAAGTTGSLFTSLGTPMRLADTRCAVSPTPSFCSGENLPSANSSLAAPSGGQSITVATGAPSGATSAALDVIDVQPSTGNFLTAYPTGATLPVVSTVNWVPGNTYNVVPNAAYATLSSSGDVSIYNGPTNAGAANVVVDMFGYFAPPVTNAVYAVSGPSPSATPTVSTSTTTTGDVTYTVSGLPTASGDTADIALFPATGTDAPVDTNGTWTFTSSSGTGVAGAAAGQGTTNVGTSGAYIASVNGVPTAGGGTTEDNSVSTDSGTLSFVLNSTVVDGTVPVVFTQPSTGNNTLQLNANGTPATGYAIGVGAATNWAAAAAPAGVYTDAIVASVNPTAGTFAATYGGGTTQVTFTYNASGDSYMYDDPAVAITEAQFASFLSGPVTSANNDGIAAVLGDEFSSITYNPSGPSSFTYGGSSTNGDVPAAPTGLTATAGTSGGVALSWTAPPNLDVSNSTDAAYYQVWRATVTNGTVGTYSDIASTIPASGSSATTTYTDMTASAGTEYSYVVTATAGADGGGQQGPASSAVTFTPAVPPSAQLAPLSTATAIGYGTGNTAGELQPGDVLAVTFNGAVSLDTSSFSLSVTNGTDTATVSNSNASAALTNSNQTVDYTITGPVPSSPAALTFSTTDPLEIIGESGVSNTVGAWNLPGSTASNGELAAFDTSSNSSLLPAGPKVTPVTSSGTTVDVTCTAVGDSVTLYSENGAAISSASTCTGSSQAIPTTVTVTPDTVLIAQQTETATPSSYLSASTVTVGFAPSPLATNGTLKSSTAVDYTVSSLPGLAINASFTAATDGGSATLNGTALSSTATAFTVASSGSLSGIYTSGTATSGTDTITVANPAATFTGTDTYTY